MVKAIDLFSGIGGIRLGFERVFDNLNTIFASEIDKFAISTYSSNFSTPKVSGDITDENIKDSIEDFNICLAGFPCQAFSIAGRRLGFEECRGTLFFEILDICNRFKPSVIFCENVKGLLSHNKGRTFQTIKRALEEIGYIVYYKVLNTKDFGIPQNRERIYIVCFNRDKIKDISKFSFNFPKPTLERVKVKDILEDNVDDKYTISDKILSGHKKRKENHVKKGNGFGFRVFSPNDHYTNTITARYYKDGSEALISQPNSNPRKLTPRECARLQGFPDTFKIPVSDTQAYKQFGNSVTVKVIEEIAKEIRKTYYNFMEV